MTTQGILAPLRDGDCDRALSRLMHANGIGAVPDHRHAIDGVRDGDAWSLGADDPHDA